MREKNSRLLGAGMSPDPDRRTGAGPAECSILKVWAGHETVPSVLQRRHR